LLILVFLFPGCLAIWLGVESLERPRDAGEDG
jgi:hypothetical protein